MTGVLIHDSLRRGTEDAQAWWHDALQWNVLVRLMLIQIATSSRYTCCQHIVFFCRRTLRKSHSAWYVENWLTLWVAKYITFMHFSYNSWLYFFFSVYRINLVSVLRKASLNYELSHASSYVISGHIIALLWHKFWSQEKSENLYLNYSKKY